MGILYRDFAKGVGGVQNIFFAQTISPHAPPPVFNEPSLIRVLALMLAIV